MGELDPVNDLVNLFLREDQAEAAGVLKTMTLRLDLAQLTMLDAMAAYAGLSRQAMARQLIKAGTSTVMAELPPEVRNEVSDDFAGRLEALRDGRDV